MKYTNSKGKRFKWNLVNKKNSKEELTYVLVVPEMLKAGQELVVESLNYEGTDIIELILPRVIEQFNMMVEVFDNSPILIPFIPDVKGGRPYYQQLSRECFVEANDGEYKIEYPRIDLQLIKTINEVKEKIKEESHVKLADQILINGYSSSGVFAQRFALIHPEIVSRALIGGAAGTIPIPSSEIDYPIGIRDFKELFGKEFNEKEYKKIFFAYYVGEFEAREEAEEYYIKENGKIPPMHDMSYHIRSTEPKIGTSQRNMFGEDLAERYQRSIKYYEKNGYNITSKIYRGVEHKWIFSRANPSFESMLRDIMSFYKDNKQFTQDIVGVERISHGRCVNQQDISK